MKSIIDSRDAKCDNCLVRGGGALLSRKLK